ncbi:MAG: serine hydrolase domain-containing protein [Pseudomonadota bacterium]
MKQFLTVIVGLVIGAAVHSQDDVGLDDVPPEANTQTDDALLEAFVDGVVATYRDAHAAPGYTVSVVRADRTVLAKGYGLSDIENATPVDPATTRFYVASISKTFVWTAAMLLVDRGELDLDKDVNDYLVDYQVPEGKRPLTVNDLMAHRSGVEETFRVWMPSLASLPLDEAIAATEPGQAFDRGEIAAYSNWGSNLVALVIQDIAGVTYESFLYDELLTPLGMTSTVLNVGSPNADESLLPISKNYRVTGNGPEEVDQIDLGAFAPIGGMSTTAVDMARWMRFLLNRGELDGVRLMKESTFELMRSSAFDPVPGSGVRAHGFADVPYHGIRYFGHTGSINEFFSKFIVAPELDIGVFISQNAADSFDPLTGVPHLVMNRELAVQGRADFLLRPDPSDDDVDAAEGIAGTYISARRPFFGPEKFVSVVQGTVDVSAKDGRLMFSGSTAPYVRVGDGLWENRNGNRIGIVRGEGGGVTRIIDPTGATDLLPVTFWTDPFNLAIGLLATVFFTVTTWLGLWRRARQVRETTKTGMFISWIALAGALPLVGLVVVASGIPEARDMRFAEFMSSWPLPLIGELTLTAMVLAGFAVLLLIFLVPAWRRTGWSIWRKLHYSFYTAAYAFLAVMLANWGLVPVVSDLFG